jgi:predicted transglutaminase-like cysteine proteinase
MSLVVEAGGGAGASASSLSGSRTTDTENWTPTNLDSVRKDLQTAIVTTPGSELSKSTDNSKKTGEKKTRRSSKEVQRDDAAECKKRKKESAGMKLATQRIQENKILSPSNPKKKTQQAIVDEVNQLYGSNVNLKTVNRMVNKGLVGVSPLKRGPVGSFPPHVWKALKEAFVTFCKLEQAQGLKQSTINDYSLKVNTLLDHGGLTKSGNWVVQKLRKETADEFSIGKKNVLEHRRQQWTTYSNLSLWFDQWEITLIELGFGRKKEAADGKDIDGSVFFFKGQRRRILNIDETDGSLDNTNGVRGGRPPIVFHSPSLSGGSTAASKSSYSPTIICGANAAGEALPPHFQIKSMAKEANQQLALDFFKHSKSVYGQFGMSERRRLDCTFRMNEKGGINAAELDKYINSAIVPLYLDIEDVPGKRVIIKVDSGPGRTNLQMLTEAKLKGLYIYPSVPNTTSVTQEADELYGPFKTVYRQNLQLLAEIRHKANKPIQITDLPILVFGQPDGWVSLPGGRRFRDAFTETFSKERCLRAWQKCGAVPLTRSPLNSSKVRHEVVINADGSINKEADPETEMLLSIENRNQFACDYLTGLGFDGKQLLIKAPRKKAAPQLTAPQSRERILALKQAKSAGQLFMATGGSHINSTDFFRACELSDREEKVSKLEKRKKKLLKAKEIRLQAERLIEQKGGTFTTATAKQWNVKELKILLLWKYGKPMNGNRDELIKLYFQQKLPVAAEEWTQDDEEELKRLKDPLIPLRETAMGVKSRQLANAVSNNIQYLSPQTKQKLRSALEDDSEDGPNVI